METPVFLGIGALVMFAVSFLLVGSPTRGRGLSGGRARARSSVLGRLGEPVLELVRRLPETLARPLRWVARAVLDLVERIVPHARARGRASSAGLVLVACLAVSLAGLMVSGSVIGAPCALAALVALSCARRAKQERAARRAVERAMPDACVSLAQALGAGRSLPQAMRYVGAHQKDPIGGEFMRVGFAMECGVAPDEALAGMLERLHVPGLDMVALALAVSKRTGAPLGELLGEAAASARDRIELVRELDVKTAQARMSANMVAAMPLCMMGFLACFSTDFRQGMATFAGAACVVVALVLNVSALVLIKRIMKVGV